MPEPRGLGRLQAALDLWRAFRDSGGDEAGFLRAHEDLRDLLEPLLHEAPAEPADSSGRVLGDFRLLREIGRGGMGVVWEARQASLDRLVAVKVLDVTPATSAKSLARFKREALTAARLRHDGIVPVFAVGEDEGVHWFAMERIDGLPLDRWVEERRRADPAGLRATIVALVAKVADALEFAHQNGVIHRDVKPSNILVRGDGTPVLTDFGLAREAKLPSMTVAGEFAGTPYYVAPEQIARQSEAVDARCDVFSLGVTLYELLTSKRPFDGATTQDVLQRILTREPEDPQRLDPTLPLDLAAVVLKALEKRADDRYSSAAALAADLRAFLALRPVQAKRLGRVTRLRRWCRREPVKAALVLVLAVGLPVVGILSSYLWSKRAVIAAGEQSLGEERLATVLVAGYRDLIGGAPHLAIAQFAAAREVEPEQPELFAGHVIALCLIDPPQLDEARAALQSHAGLLAREPALRRLQSLIHVRAEAPAAAAALERELPPPSTARDWFMQGMVEARRPPEPGKPRPKDVATACFRRAVLAAPRAMPVYHSMLLRALDLGSDDAAVVQVVDGMLAQWPENQGVLLECGRALHYIDRPRALALLRKLRRLVPEWLDAIEALADMLERGAETDAALAEIEAGLRQQPRHAGLLALRGATKLRSNDLRSAIADARAALQTDKQHAIAMYVIGQAMLMQGDTGNAIRWLERCSAARPDLTEARLNLAVALSQRGEFERALALYSDVLADQPGVADIRFNYAVTLRDAGRRDDALRETREVLRLDPQHTDARRLLEELQR
jgi:serine/threonine protein kinase/tetratricopeptide (TPR) repeat protein